MKDLTTFNLERTTTEILVLKDQTAQNIIEIGKRLIEVKENLQHGEFMKWLENKVDISDRTARNFMKVATTFSNWQPVANLGTRKLLALAGLEEKDRQEIIQENNIESITTREVEQLVKEKKEIKKKLQEEQEYSNELQQSIKEKDKQIQELKQKNNEPQIIEKEVIKEVTKEIVPKEIQQQIDRLEEERDDLLNKYENAKSTIVNMNNVKNNEMSGKYYDYGFDCLSGTIAEFIRNVSKYSYMEQEYSELSESKKILLKKGIKKVEDWILDMKKVMNETLMIGNNIYVEEENKDE